MRIIEFFLFCSINICEQIIPITISYITLLLRLAFDGDARSAGFFSYKGRAIYQNLF